MDCSGAFLVVLCGLPGSGKTTLSQLITNKLQEQSIQTELLCFDKIEQRYLEGQSWSPLLWHDARQQVQKSIFFPTLTFFDAPRSFRNSPKIFQAAYCSSDR